MGSVPDILAIIESAKARGGVDGLERHVNRALPGATDTEIHEATLLALEVIEAVPVFLLRAWQESEERGLGDYVNPLLERAERYYLRPIDLIPEMTQGLAGLLDDSYFVMRILQHLDRGERPFLDWDLDDPVRFLARLIGPSLTRRLDRIAAQEIHEVERRIADLWDRSAHDA